MGHCSTARVLKQSNFLLKPLKQPREGYSIVRKNLVFWSLCVFRFGMLSDESVPHADSVLASLAKHLEAKLSFGETQAHFISANQTDTSTKCDVSTQTTKAFSLVVR